MRDSNVQREIKAYRAALKSGLSLPDLPPRNGGKRVIEGQWFAKLSLNP
jgi:hypothetical protein